MELAEAAPAGDDGVTVGVGPVEDLLDEHGEDIMGLLIDGGRRSPASARALNHCAAPDSLSSAALAQLDAFRAR